MSYIKELEEHIKRTGNEHRFIPSAKFRGNEVIYTRLEAGTFYVGDRLRIIDNEISGAPQCINQNGDIKYSNYYRMRPFMVNLNE